MIVGKGTQTPVTTRVYLFEDLEQLDAVIVIKVVELLVIRHLLS
jgi:hypothetical protein